MGLTLLDSSIVIAWLYADDAHHSEGVAAVERETDKRQNLCMSVVGWMEVLAGTGRRDWPAMRQMILCAERASRSCQWIVRWQRLRLPCGAGSGHPTH